VTPLMLAAASYDADAMRILAAGGTDARLATEHDEETGGNVTALMVAAGLARARNRPPLAPEDEKKALEAVKLAVEMGADVNAANDLGLTALHAAAFGGSNQIVQFLAEKGANLDAKDQSGQSPLEKASNIRPNGVVSVNLVPRLYHKTTADLLVKLGATPVNTPVAESSEAAKAPAANEQ